MSYDKNGNILTLNRTGNVDGFEQVIDDLTYDYIGNQLQSVTDADHGNQYFGFVDGNQQGNDYQYDMFGNMIQDLNKEIEEIKYNHLNLPTTIIFANGGVIAYLYDAMGVKVRKYVHQQGANNSWTDYLNGFQYSNEILQFFPHAEGYVQYYQEGEENGNTNQGNDGAPLQEGFSYVYQYKDHLGNNRLNYTLNREGTLSILSEDHYYPFGMKHPYNNDRREWAFIRIENIPTPFVRQVPNSGYQYKYNGKEWQDELGLNVTAMDFRQYDSAIGRFYAIDKVAELQPDWNPYRFAFNNPVFWKDPSGLSETNDNTQTIELDEVVITAKKRNNVHDTGPPTFMLYQYMPKKYNAIGLDDFNKKYNTNFKSFDDWYYRTKYLPVKMDMIRSMHSAQETAGKYVAMLVGGVALAAYMSTAITAEALGSAIVSQKAALTNLAYGGVTRYAGMNMTANAFGQLAGNNGNLSKVNFLEVGASGFSGVAPIVIGSSFNLSYESLTTGSIFNNPNEIGVGTGVGLVTSAITNKVQLPRSIMTDAYYVTYQGILNASVNTVGTKLTNELNEN